MADETGAMGQVHLKQVQLLTLYVLNQIGMWSLAEMRNLKRRGEGRRKNPPGEKYDKVGVDSFIH